MNSELYNKQYRIPPDVLKAIEIAKASSSDNNGLKRANFILKNGILTYQAMKRLKHDFDTNNFSDKTQYALAGGNLMKIFIEKTLNSERNAVKTSKDVRRDIHVNPNSELMPYQVSNVNVQNLKEMVNEVEKKDKKKNELQKNAVAVIVNNDNKILLLKRGKGAPWMPSKWGLVGGGVEKGETPQKAVSREIKEETGLEIDKFIKTFSIQRKSDSIEHVFACRYDGDPTDISLNDEENTNYGWYDIDEMNYLDIVPNLVEYVTLAFTGEKYS